MCESFEFLFLFRVVLFVASLLRAKDLTDSCRGSQAIIQDSRLNVVYADIMAPGLKTHSRTLQQDEEYNDVEVVEAYLRQETR